MTVQLLGKDDPGFDNADVLTQRWQEYIESYARVSDVLEVDKCDFTHVMN